ncbi:MAG: 3-hydroxyacyl-CoA dehydrogenase [Hyphomicrobiales bacterium]|nr:3-hydroxyacyl-CoA dehydrogenase [Hyphomicrobiales bacterium]
MSAAAQAPEGGRVRLERDGAVGVIVIDNPPVNAGSYAVRRGLVDAVAQLNSAPDLTHGVIIGAGRTFISGSDIKEFGKPLQHPLVPDVIVAIEQSPKPIVAAISGAALGGGYEIALACDARVASPQALVGLPEVRLGIIPGAGGTQRLPRLIGMERAIDIVCSARRVPGPEALALGMVDALADDLRADACRFALGLRGKSRLRDRAAPPVDDAALADAKARALKAARGLGSVAHALRALDLAISLPIDEALREERAIFEALRTGEEAAALRHLFFAEREALKLPDGGGSARDIRKVGVLGAGTMGAGIAVAFLQAGYEVALIDTNDAAIARARDFIAKEMRSDSAPATLQAGGGMELLAECDLVLEAIIEDMAAKQGVLSRAARIAPQALLASNTSYLDLDEIARATGRAGELVGLHFFSPAHKMKLLEVVRGAATSHETLASALSIAKRLRKIAVVAGVGEGFIGNRIYGAYRRHCEFMVEEGAAPQQVDAALRAFGFAMGPFAVGDMSGLDIAWRMRQRLAPSRDPRERYVAIADRLCELGRFGRKTGAGWYRYGADAPGGQPDPVVAEVIASCAQQGGLAPRAFSDAEIVSRALGAMINEAGNVLADGVAQRASDIDLVFVNGYGFPASKGGPLFWASRQPRAEMEAALDAVERAQGFGFRRCDLGKLLG